MALNSDTSQILISDWGTNSIRSFTLQGSEVTDNSTFIDQIDKPIGILFTPVIMVPGEKAFL